MDSSLARFAPIRLLRVLGTRRFEQKTGRLDIDGDGGTSNDIAATAPEYVMQDEQKVRKRPRNLQRSDRYRYRAVTLRSPPLSPIPYEFISQSGKKAGDANREAKAWLNPRFKGKMGKTTRAARGEDSAHSAHTKSDPPPNKEQVTKKRRSTGLAYRRLDEHAINTSGVKYLTTQDSTPTWKPPLWSPST